MSKKCTIKWIKAHNERIEIDITLSLLLWSVRLDFDLDTFGLSAMMKTTS